MTAGERFKIIRKASGLNQTAIGELLGVSKGQVSNIEKGTSQLTKGHAIVLANHFGFEVNWLLKGEGPPPFIDQPNSNASISGNSFNSSSRGNEVTIGAQTGVQHDLQAENEKLKLEIDYLKQRLKDKEEMIELLKKK